MNCTHEQLHSFDNSDLACQYLKTCNYSNSVDYFNLLTFNYCVVQNKQYITWPLIALTFVLCFFFLSTTVDEYTSRILGRISVKLNMSQNLAGLTLLAFGNQAVDILVALITGDEDNGGIEASLSTILGADSLVVGFVMPTVIFLGNGVIVKGQNFIRDLLTYLIGLSFIIFIGFVQKQLNIIYGAIIFILYIIYVFICIMMENEHKKKAKKDEESESDENEDESIDNDKPNDFKVKLLVTLDETKNTLNKSIKDDKDNKNDKDNKDDKNDKDENKEIDKENNEKENKGKKSKKNLENEKEEKDKLKKNENNSEENYEKQENADNKNNKKSNEIELESENKENKIENLDKIEDIEKKDKKQKKQKKKKKKEKR